MWNSYSPFSIEVWLVILLTLLVQAASATLIRYVEWKIFKINSTFQPWERLWHFGRAFLLQDYRVGFKSYAGRKNSKNFHDRGENSLSH
jgi:hypothetical protein